MILVTGAAGFLGRAVTRSLVANGLPVRALDLAWRDAAEAEAAVCQRHTGDLRDPAVCRAAVAGIDGIVHAAAVQFHTPGCPRVRLGRFFRRNVEMTGGLLAAAAAAGVRRFVHVSSAMVYGRPGPRPLREGDPTRPLGPYGRSKVACEDLCRLARGRIAHVSILRASAIIGPGRLGLLRRLCDRALAHRPIPLFDGGRHRHHLVAVGDVAEACRLALERSAEGTYNIASPEPSTVRALLSALCRELGSRSRLVAVPAPVAEAACRLLWALRLAPLKPEQFLIATREYVLDISLARAALGFEPRCRDMDTLLATCRWYRDRRRM